MQYVFEGLVKMIEENEFYIDGIDIARLLSDNPFKKPVTIGITNEMFYGDLMATESWV